MKGRWLHLLWLGLLLLWVFFYGDLVALLKPWLPIRGKLLLRTPLYELALQHFGLALMATTASLVTAFGLSVIARISRHKGLEALMLALANIGETLPSAAAIALAVPLLGYGNGPVAFALYLYGILPILRNALTGFNHLDEALSVAAEGMGMNRWQQLYKVEIPLALPLIVAGLRMALVVNISAATIGATVGAGGLGVPIMAGIRTRDFVTLFQGSVAVLLMALWADSLVKAIEGKLMRFLNLERSLYEAP